MICPVLSFIAGVYPLLQAKHLSLHCSALGEDAGVCHCLWNDHPQTVQVNVTWRLRSRETITGNNNLGIQLITFTQSKSQVLYEFDWYGVSPSPQKKKPLTNWEL